MEDTMHTPSIAQIEMAPQLAADERIDADAGRELLRSLAAKWHDQGYNGRLAGMDLADMWCREMRAGWREADNAIEAIHAEADDCLATGTGYSWDLPTTPAVIAAIHSTQQARSSREARHAAR